MPFARRGAQSGRQRVNAVRIIENNIHRALIVVEAEKAPRLGHGNKGKVQIIFRQADTKNRGNLKLLEARRGAERRNRATRRDKRQPIADVKAITLGQTRAYGDVALFVQIIKATGQHIAFKARQLLELFHRQAAHQYPTHGITRRQHGLAVQKRHDQHHTVNLQQSRHQRLAVVIGGLVGADGGMAVNAQYTLEQIGAKTGHHCHHDNQRGDAQHNSQKGNTGDNRDEAVAATRAQIATGYLPFQRAESSAHLCPFMRPALLPAFAWRPPAPAPAFRLWRGF